MKPRRDKLKLYGDLLTVLYNEANAGKIVPTRVSIRMGVSFDRLKNYISELYALGLIEDENTLKITEKGKKFLREYKKILDFLKDMGIVYK
jgi:predicted transcriptional regulator